MPYEYYILTSLAIRPSSDVLNGLFIKRRCHSSHVTRREGPAHEWNVIEWVTNPFPSAAGCVTLDAREPPTLENVCRRLDPDSQIITLFAENYTPLNCRSSLEGVFHFAYQVQMNIIICVWDTPRFL